MGSAHNLTLVVIPPISLAVLAATSLHGVAAMAVAFVLAGSRDRPHRAAPFPADRRIERRPDGPTDVARRRLGFAFRRAWAPLIAIDLLYIVHWGVIVAFLPQRAEAAGADIGLFFVADGIAILLSRVPSGWLADRIRPIFLILAGLAATGGAVVLLTLPPTTPLLIVAGALTGAGGGLVITPILVELSRRSLRRRPGQRVLAVLGRQRDGARDREHRRGDRPRRSGFEVAMLATFGRGAGGGAARAPGPGLRRPPSVSRSHPRPSSDRGGSRGGPRESPLSSWLGREDLPPVTTRLARTTPR